MYRKKRQMIGVLLVMLLFLTSGCVQIVGEGKVNWIGQGEVGFKLLTPTALHKLLTPMIVESLGDVEGSHLQEIKEGDKVGWRWLISLQTLQERLKTNRLKPIFNKDIVQIETRDYWLFQTIDLHVTLDLSAYDIPSYISLLVKPKIELTLPIPVQNNADHRGKHNSMIWSLSFSQPNDIWLKFWLPNIGNILIVAVPLLLIIILAIILFIRKRRLKLHR